jgi:hypothetical protein
MIDCLLMNFTDYLDISQRYYTPIPYEEPADTEMTTTAYSDPTADIVLGLNTGVTVRVHSYQLRAFRYVVSLASSSSEGADHSCSTFFRDMLSSPSSLTGNGNTPKDNIIDFPHDPEDVIQLLDYMHKRQVPKFTTFKAYENVVRLADRYGCDIVIDRIVARLYNVVDTAPWKIFCLASHVEELELAKVALNQLALDPEARHLKVGEFTTALASGCTLPYFLGFVSLAVEHSSSGYRYMGYTGVQWTASVDKFKPAK